jgi:hypothetical protein
MHSSRFDHLTRHLARRATRRTALGTAFAGLGLASLDSLVAAQEATPPSDATPVAEGDKGVYMFVQTFAAGRGEVNPGAGTPVADGASAPAGGASILLTLDGHTGHTLYFSDRPERVVGAIPTERFLETLGFTQANPPNAALVAEFERGQGVVVLELIEPVFTPETDTLTYGAEVLEAYEGGILTPVLAEQIAERLPATLGPGALFIDSCPAYASCYKSTEMNDYDLAEYVGPIPNGPYPQCVDPVWGGCMLCDQSLNAWNLHQMCRDYYHCDSCYAYY